MRLKILPKIFLLLGFLALVLVIQYQDKIKEVWDFNMEKLRIHRENLFYQAGPEAKRHRPVSLLQKETELKAGFPNPFVRFNENSWNDFWNIIYGAFPVEEPEKPGLPRRMRQLTPAEIAQKLKETYPNPFNYFKDEHWQVFFGIILKKR
ncbi:MAG: hypothetical protein FJZ09_03575 [Candidatus Omnitrophica bacterium]|nr:hypothetical protein [Candidatus Omnitrophota bacterium]